MHSATGDSREADRANARRNGRAREILVLLVRPKHPRHCDSSHEAEWSHAIQTRARRAVQVGADDATQRLGARWASRAIIGNRWDAVRAVAWRAASMLTLADWLQCTRYPIAGETSGSCGVVHLQLR